MSPAWLATPTMNARDTTKGRYGGLTLDMDRHYIGSVTATTHQEKVTITLESNPSRGTVLSAPHGKGNKCDKNVKDSNGTFNDVIDALFSYYFVLLIDIYNVLEV